MRSSLGRMVLPLWFVLGVVSAQSTSPAAPSLSIDLSSEQNNIKAGTGIWVDAVTTNISHHRVAIGFLPGPYESAFISMTVQVRDSEDHPVGPEKVDQSACKGKPDCDVLDDASRYLIPGETAKDHFLLHKLYNLTKPGVYTIKVVYHDKRTSETVESNTLIFTVNP